MSVHLYFLLFVCIYSGCSALPNKNQLTDNSVSKDLVQNNKTSTSVDKDFNNITEKVGTTMTADKDQEKVFIQLYYECLCPFSTQFYTEIFIPAIRELGQYLDVRTYPYGNAKTIERNGSYVFHCQHGSAECYGNKLHACSLDLLQNKTQALVFNSCLMNSDYDDGSDDSTADKCGKEQNVDADSIKNCAKSENGTLLLKYYGDESTKGHYNYVPYLKINGKHRARTNFTHKVCAAFTVPPRPCEDILNSDRNKE